VRALHVVGLSDDGSRLLLAGSPDAARPSHSVPLDDRLRAAARGDFRRVVKAQSALSPKEIQSRMRSGESLDEVAKAAGVPAARIAAYAGPVLSERERVLDDARAAAPQRDRGVRGLPLGEAVAQRLATVNGMKPATVAWSARRRDDGSWVVRLGYTARGGARSAEWTWRPATRELRPLGVAASRLTAPVASPAAAPTARRTAAKRAASGTGGRQTTASAPVGRGRRAAVKTSATPPAVAAPVAAAATRTAGPARRARPGGTAGVKQRAAARAGATPTVEPPLDAGSGQNKRGRTARNGRAAVPAWSDVLFGVGSGTPPVAGAPDEAAAAPARRRAGADGRGARGSSAAGAAPVRRPVRKRG
jgi:hypothetical protein